MSDKYLPQAFVNKDVDQAGRELLGDAYQPQLYSHEVRAPRSLQNNVNCDKCSKAIQGAGIESQGKKFHPDCFECSQCGRVIRSESFVVRGGQPWCDSCVEWSRKERSAGAPQSKPVAATAGASSSSSPSAQAKQQGPHSKTICTGCQQEIVGQGMYVNDGVFHPQCFKCAHCNNPIEAAGGFVPRDGQAYHAECAKLAFAKKCSGCNQPLTGPYLNVMNGQYHKECFRCSQCNTPCTSGYAERAGKPVCPNCATAQQQSTTTTTVTPGAQGIRVDPRSGRVWNPNQQQ